MAAEDRNVRGNKIKPDEVDARVVDAEELYENGNAVNGAPDYVEGHSTQGSAGTVPTAQSDGSLAMQEVGGLWTRDGSSSASSAASLTYTLSTNYDQVLVSLKDIYGDDAGSNHQLQLQVNGSTSNHYDTLYIGGTREVGISYANLGQISNVASNDVSGHLLLEGRWTHTHSGTAMLNGFNSTSVASNYRAGITGPLSSLSLQIGADNISGNIEVFGRDLQ